MRKAAVALVSDAQAFYEQQRSIGAVWGVVLPCWEELSWDERITWEDRLAEQMTRDKEDA
jgi:hypothetical protein